MKLSDSPFVERVGSGEWVLWLVVSKKSEG